MVIPIPARSGRVNEVRSSHSYFMNDECYRNSAGEKAQDVVRCGLRLSAGEGIHLIADERFAAVRLDVQVSAAIEKA
ncbi:hypothetical protein [Paenibacillus harenae]|uniref:Uncharacterized protein n=1 Tax=Paenibacillus harenae TaxID=306543 RepID=A0ABT9TZN3_PAEHA|nr:hypothetical protein [Paenibacillus harenae]MDQ0059381.1 hypothetical protein [Paenibacillus harenae]MDQ0112847.1 hypothetical protein [Paenibacillus harenae]